MRKYILSLFIGTAFLGCSKDDALEQPKFIGKTFDHLFFQTEQECMDSQTDPNFFINCHQELSFADTEKAQLMLTDIMYSVNYSIKENKVIIHPDASTIEFQQDIVFEIISDSSLKLVSNNSLWNERTGSTLWD